MPDRKQKDPAQSRAASLARLYDLDLEDEPGDVEMYLAFADAADGPILELMAGTGRVAVPLAMQGNRVVAVDSDPHMLERAATRWQDAKDRAAAGGALEPLDADVTSLLLEERFLLVIVALNSLLLLEGRDAQRELFAVIAKHLAHDGRAVIDVWLPTPDDLALYDGRVILDWVRDDPDTGRHVSKQTAARYESATRTAHVMSIFDEWHDGEIPTRTLREDTISFVSFDELQSFARDAGLELENIAGDYEMGHFANGSDRVVMVCRAASR